MSLAEITSGRSAANDAEFVAELQKAMAACPGAGLLFTVLDMDIHAGTIASTSTGQVGCGIYHLMAAADDLLQRAERKLTARIGAAPAGEARDLALIELQRIGAARAALDFLEPEAPAT